MYLLSIAAGSLAVGVGYALVKTGQVELPGATLQTQSKPWSVGAGNDGATA